jgi:hypothetical protein
MRIDDRQLVHISDRGGYRRSVGPVVSLDDELVVQYYDQEALAEIERERGIKGVKAVIDDIRNILARGRGVSAEALTTVDKRNPRQGFTFVQGNGMRVHAIVQKVDD